mmetsp:Transcript_40604/g.115728  ORF Transcript_40604/g.115728 Transcript_40604/m.115728 type:complete len:320 (+) Transcript_40604:1020-1979(+)
MDLNIETRIPLRAGKTQGMPAFGLGTWRSEPNKVTEAVECALSNGYIHLDCAAIYRNEHEVGDGIAKAIAAGKITRDKLWVTSKLWCTKFRPEDVKSGLQKTLDDLGLEYIDQYLPHWPCPMVPSDIATEPWPKDENGVIRAADVGLTDTWRAMEKLVDEGLVKTLGMSNFNIEETKLILDNCDIPPVVDQVECHPLFPQHALRDFLKSENIELVAYSPLGNVNTDGPTALTDPLICDLGNKYSKSPAQICLRWNLQRGVIVIPKSVTPSRVVENSKVFDLQLSADDMARINNLSEHEGRGRRQINPDFRPGGAKVFKD